MLPKYILPEVTIMLILLWEFSYKPESTCQNVKKTCLHPTATKFFYVHDSLGMNSSMFVNCSVFCVVRHVWSSVLGQNVMFGSVRSSVLLLCDQTSLGTYSLMFANCLVFCDVRHVRSSILGQNVMFGHSMFVVFEVWYFGVRSKTKCTLEYYEWYEREFRQSFLNGLCLWARL